MYQGIYRLRPPWMPISFDHPKHSHDLSGKVQADHV